jgi:hypothetical protein
MEGKKVKYIAALLLALALLAVPGLAFVPTVPTEKLEKITDPMSSDFGTYSYTRVNVDVGDETNALPFSPQHVYSGILFGADEKDTFVASNKLWDAYTAGVVANDMKTDAMVANPDFNPAEPISDKNPAFIQGVATGTTRQYIQQTGTAWIAQYPSVVSDNENTVPYSTEMGFEKSQFAWISSKMDQFIATPASQAAVGGNFLESVPKELSPDCQNAWLIEREASEGETPITVTAYGDADLREAFAGIESTSGLKLYPAGSTEAGLEIPADALMSGYTERFAGYDKASIAANIALSDADPTNANAETWSDNVIVMDVGTTPVENFWMTWDGVEFDAPQASDFPNEDDSSKFYGWVTWPDDAPQNEL